MSSKNSGMKAFPATVPEGGTQSFNPGMTLRDYFAGQALMGLMSDHDNMNTLAKDAEAAYKMADAMIEEREMERLEGQPI